MSDLIKREPLSAWLANMGHPKLAEYVMDKSRFPSVQPERKTGHWIKLTGMMPPEHHGHYECSECGFWAMRDWGKPWRNGETNGAVLTKYCPGCGSQMQLGENYALN